MAIRDLIHNLSVIVALAAQVVTADQNGATIDLKGYGSALLSVNVGAEGDTLSGSVKFDFKVQESDDGSSWADCSADDLLKASGAPALALFATVDANAEAHAVYSVGYRGVKRYIRVVVDATGTHTNGTPISATAVLGNPELKPVANT